MAIVASAACTRQAESWRRLRVLRLARGGGDDPFFSMVVAAGGEQHHAVRAGSVEEARLHDAYLDRGRFGASESLRAALDLALRIGPLTRALGWMRVLEGLPPREHAEWGDYVSGWLRDLARSSSAHDQMVDHPMTQAEAETVAAWRYAGEYAFYDADSVPGDLSELLDPQLRADELFAGLRPAASLEGFVELEPPGTRPSRSASACGRYLPAGSRSRRSRRRRSSLPGSRRRADRARGCGVQSAGDPGLRARGVHRDGPAHASYRRPGLGIRRHAACGMELHAAFGSPKRLYTCALRGRGSPYMPWTASCSISSALTWCRSRTRFSNAWLNPKRKLSIVFTLACWARSSLPTASSTTCSTKSASARVKSIPKCSCFHRLHDNTR